MAAPDVSDSLCDHEPIKQDQDQQEERHRELGYTASQK